MTRVTLYSPTPSSWQIDPGRAVHDHGALHVHAGATVGLVSNGKLAGFSDALAARLAANGAGRVEQFEKYYQEGPPDEALVGEISRLVDAALVGLGN